ncbi:tRNA 2-selenouridine(34) synthase MnmH [Dechloromonas sp. XY25]|uniref:tRNA 2-selenouridine(34) synthase MnmH n=1 Tax=Dechloromonas hankyongensis TaxID=2908002 RepID=A0ABS9K2E7_9RHOO|nr:tRNA 2-selenouridine(34) synthase MnmH [Dechloromonas hankyongensis]MCG2577350.1 tRNA 2-selenouridine(34) synthase MnmH [Dechloromonas hankyongensis]
MKRPNPTVADIPAYDQIIDVRSPAEFAEDHIPGAINCPVLDNEQRIQIGTLYKQVSPFEAKKLGAALVSENIARHLKEQFLDRPKNWKPLIYCWRGGDRSGSMTTVFRAVGWHAGQLDGGYKSWRSHVIAQLAELPAQFRFTVLCGATGNAKTRILQALGDQGEQILDLETLACHKGSVLGVLPDQPQPSQKAFETALLQALSCLDPARPVFVEAESRKIGNLHVPEALIARIRQGDCIHVDATLEARVSFLLKDYDYFLCRPELLTPRLEVLRSQQSRETIARWHELVSTGDWPALVRELLEIHYDPLYHRSQNTNFTGQQHPETFTTDDLSPAGITRLADAIAQSRTAQMA